MARKQVEERVALKEKVPCFGHFSDEPDADTCDPDYCKDYNECKIATLKNVVGEKANEGERKMAVDLSKMDRKALLAFAKKEDIQLQGVTKETTEEEIRDALQGYLDSVDEQAPEDEEPAGAEEEEELEEEEEEEEELEEEEKKETEEEEGEEVVGEATAEAGGSGKKSMKRKRGAGVKVDRMSNGIFPKTFATLRKSLEAEYGQLRDKKSIVNVLIGNRLFMGVTIKKSTESRIMTIVYGSGKWDIGKLESKVERWNDKRHGNEVRVIVMADDIPGGMEIINQLAAIHKKKAAEARAEEMAAPMPRPKGRPKTKIRAEVEVEAETVVEAEGETKAEAEAEGKPKAEIKPKAKK